MSRTSTCHALSSPAARVEPALKQGNLRVGTKKVLATDVAAYPSNDVSREVWLLEGRDRSMRSGQRTFGVYALGGTVMSFRRTFLCMEKVIAWLVLASGGIGCQQRSPRIDDDPLERRPDLARTEPWPDGGLVCPEAHRDICECGL